MKVVEWNEKPGRYICIDEETGAILEDCNGWGFKTPESAIKSYNYNHKDEMKSNVKELARIFFNQHKDLYKSLLDYKIKLDSIGEKISTDDIRSFLQIKGIESPVEIKYLKELLGKLAED